MARNILPIETLSAEVQALVDAVNDEGDLPCVLMCANYLDQCLASLLQCHLVKGNTSKTLLDAGGGLLGSFLARADLCYCLGIIPKAVYQNLRSVAEIRNRFAHSHLSLSFADEDVVALCESLKLPKMVGKRVDGRTGQSWVEHDPFQKFQEARSKFTICVVCMATYLLRMGRSVERRPVPKAAGWD